MNSKYIIDFGPIEQVSADCNKTLASILSAFLISSKEGAEDFFSAITYKDIAMAGRASHGLKSTYSYFASSGVSQELEKIEQDSYKRVSFDELEDQFNIVKLKISYIESEVRERLIELGGYYE